jgi:hypothetical protein
LPYILSNGFEKEKREEGSRKVLIKDIKQIVTLAKRYGVIKDLSIIIKKLGKQFLESR